jgi:hypothetical protein
MEQREVDRLRRHLRAFADKTDDPETFAILVGLAAEFDELLGEAARKLAATGTPKPYTWREIAAPLGVSRQAAHKRWGTRVS